MIRTIAWQPSRLANEIRHLAERLSAVEEALYHPDDSQSGISLGGLGKQTIDDLNDIVDGLRGIQLSCSSQLDIVAAHLSEMGLRLTPDDDDNNGILGHLVDKGGQRVLPVATRKALADKP